MSLSGLITDKIFSALNSIPARRSVITSTHHVGLNTTTILNGFSLCVVAFIIWAYRQKPGESSDFAVDPVCGMQVRKSDAAATAKVNGVDYYFCMEGCKTSFLARQR